MCKGFEEHCSKTQNADPEDKEMKNRDLGYHGWLVWVHTRWRFPVKYSLTNLRTEGLLDWTWSLSCQRTNSSYIWLFYGYFLKRVAENECTMGSAAPCTSRIQHYLCYVQGFIKDASMFKSKLTSFNAWIWVAFPKNIGLYRQLGIVRNSFRNKHKQDRQRDYNVILRRVCAVLM